MIFVDTSVVLAQILGEDMRPAHSLWSQPLIASRLLEYEVWTRLHARKLESSHGDATRQLIDGLALVELTPHVLARALEPFPLPVRTLDALHLASIHHLKTRDQKIRLASYDNRMNQVAEAMGIELLRLQA